MIGINRKDIRAVLFYFHRIALVKEQFVILVENQTNIFFQEFVVKMWSNQENRVRKRMLRHVQLGNKFSRCRAVALYISMEETSFSSKLEGGFSL